MLKERGADLNALDTTGATPTIAAAQVGNRDGIKALHEMGADINLRSFTGSLAKPRPCCTHFGSAGV